MIHTILTTAIGSITSLIIGYLIKSLSNYKKRDDVQSKALRNILKGNLVNQFYVYKYKTLYNYKSNYIFLHTLALYVF